jgi:sulfur transfer complex TusBCD TusB component (DsrH family)
LKQNSIFIGLLGDFYQTVGAGYLIEGIDNIYTKIIFDKYQNIINKYMFCGNIKNLTVKACFIDRNSYSYDNGFLVVDIFKNPVNHAVGTVNSESIIEKINFIADGFYLFSDKKKDEITSCNDRYQLVYMVLSEESLSNIVFRNNGLYDADDSLKSEIVDLISFSRLHQRSTKNSVENITNILLGSKFILDTEETVVRVEESTVFTDHHIYDIGENTTWVVAGDVLVFGTALSRLSSIVESVDNTSSLEALKNTISTSVENTSFVEALYSSLVKQTQSIEISKDIFYSNNSSSLGSVAVLVDAYSDVSTTLTIEPIVTEDNFSFAVKDSSVIQHSTTCLAIEDASLLISIKENPVVNLNNEDFLILEDKGDISSSDDFKYDASKISDSSEIALKDASDFLLTEGDFQEVETTGEIEGTLIDVDLGTMSEHGSMVNLFHDITTFIEDPADSQYLIYSNTIANGLDSSSSTAKLLYASIIDAVETPVYAVSKSPSALITEHVKYTSKVYATDEIGISENNATIILSTNGTNATEHIKSIIIEQDNIAPGSSDKYNAKIEAVDNISFVDNDIRKIHSTSSEITIFDIVTVDTDTEIDS